MRLAYDTAVLVACDEATIVEKPCYALRSSGSPGRLGGAAYVGSGCPVFQRIAAAIGSDADAAGVFSAIFAHMVQARNCHTSNYAQEVVLARKRYCGPAAQPPDVRRTQSETGVPACVIRSSC